ncbi:hypothetical protein [Burkholderia stabilis]|uniref:hypothetical protein n=1 Tax=Burkholderia stabilis TaxID=95485 RepID=UPI00158EBB6D|nr:hypothetical protein [Burkholderia stabilis]
MERTVRVRPVEIPAAWRGVPATGCSILVKMTETLTDPQLLDIRRMILPSRPRMTVGEGTELTVVNWKDGRVFEPKTGRGRLPGTVIDHLFQSGR